MVTEEDREAAEDVASRLEGISGIVKRYIALRDKIAHEEAEFKAKIQAKKDMLEKVEDVLKQHFDSTGTDSLSVRGVGTAYKSMRSSTSVADWDSFFGFVQQNEAWNMLEHRANKTSVMEHLKEAGELPPGINLSQQVVVQIRRG